MDARNVSWKKPLGRRPFGHRSPIGAPQFFIRAEMALPKMACHFRQSHLSSTFLSRPAARISLLSPQNCMQFWGDRMDSRGRAFGELFFPSHLWLGEKHVERRKEIAKKIPLGTDLRSVPLKKIKGIEQKSAGPRAQIEGLFFLCPPKIPWNFRGTTEKKRRPAAGNIFIKLAKWPLKQNSLVNKMSPLGPQFSLKAPSFIYGPSQQSHFCPPKIACNFGGTE